MNRLPLLIRSVIHTRPSQLAARVGLTARRHWRATTQRVLPPPRWWYRSSPPVRSACGALGPDPLGMEQDLPASVDLAGARAALDVPVDWDGHAVGQGTQLQRMHLHYMDYLDGLAPEARGALIEDWLRVERPFEPGYWKVGWNSYSLSIRVVHWIRALSRDAVALDEGGLARVRDSLARQLRFLERNLETDIGGNHLVRNIRALAYAAAYFDGPEAARWGGLAESLLDRELDDQVLADGMHFELSPAYHVQVLHDLLECYELLRPSPVRERLGQRLDAMAQVAVDLTHPDGHPSLFNDGGLHMTLPPASALGYYERLRGTTVSPRARWRLDTGGFAGARFGNDLVVVDCGRVGADHLPAHGHGDVLAFEWSLSGRRFVVDAGVFEYRPGVWRTLSRSTRAHNTLTLDDRDQAEFWSSFRIGRRPDPEVEAFRETDEGGFDLTGSHDGYRSLDGSPRHRRTFRVRKDGIDVDDQVLDGRGQTAVTRILLAPDVRVVVERKGAVLQQEDVTVRLSTAMPLEVEDADWMPDFGRRVPTRRLCMQVGTAPCRGSYRLRVERRG